MHSIRFLYPYEPNVKAVISFLRTLGVKVNHTTVNETLQNHPEWPSLLCISDSLHTWQVPNGAGKINPADIDQIPTPFIARTYDPAAPLFIVTDVSKTTVSGLHKDYTNFKSDTKEDFIKNWDGVYLIAEPIVQSGEAEYKSNKQKALIYFLLPISVLLLIIVYSIIWINKWNVLSPVINTLGIYIQYFILLSGVFISSLLLWYELDKANPILQKVCTGIVKGNCNAILSGKKAKINSWLSWSEVGFFHFAGGIILLLFSGNLNASLNVLLWINLLALPYTIFSVYYQWRVARQWCVLCLVIQALLLLGAINSLIYFTDIRYTYTASFFVSASASYLLPALSWYTLKPYFKELQEAKTTNRSYSRLKFNTEIFDTLLKKQPKLALSAEGLGIDLGNAIATNTLIKVCNPYCGPCAKAHPLIDELLQANNNIRAKIIFTTANEESNPAIKPVRHLLAIAERGDPSLTHHALDDWYLAEHKDYDAFASKYRMNGELLLQDEKIERMAEWCKKTDIQYTPTIFVNGHKLPDAYSVEDLKYFLLD